MDDDLDPVAFDLDRRLLRCDECGDVSTGRAEGWRGVWDCDDELAVFCPEVVGRSEFATGQTHLCTDEMLAELKAELSGDSEA